MLKSSCLFRKKTLKQEAALCSEKFLCGSESVRQAFVKPRPHPSNDPFLVG